MLTVEKKKKYTEEDYVLLEEGSLFQLINYNLVMSPSPLLLHQLVLGEFYDALKFHVKATGCGMVVIPPMDVKFDEGNIFQPDLIYISKERIAEIAKDRIEGAPDLVVEVLSPSNAYYDLRQKRDIYERYGVKEYIIIDPISKDAEVYVLIQNTFQLHQKAKENDKLISTVVPGLSIDMAAIFSFDQ